MPTYEYRCPDGHTFERRAKMSEAASELECPTCGKIATRQLSGGAGLVFKGSGFYLTDYGKNAHRGTAPDAANGARKSRESSDGDSKAGDSASSSKTAEAKSTEGKSSEKAETKSSEAKPVESKSGDKSGGGAAAPSSSSTKKSDQ
jgi:putative FmdB family regulatory protein